MVVGNGGKVMAGCGWSLLIVDGRGWSHGLVMLKTNLYVVNIIYLMDFHQFCF